MNENAEIKRLLYSRKIVAEQKIDPDTGEKILWPVGYDDRDTIREGSLWFIEDPND